MDSRSDKESVKAIPAPADSDLGVGETIEVKEGEKLKRDVSPHMVHVRTRVFLLVDTLSPNGKQVISLGCNIGSGLLVAMGKALHTGGPGNMVIAYALLCTCVGAVLQTLAEMTIAFPVSGNFVNYAQRWLDPSLAFAAGFAEWLGWTAVSSAEATVFTVIVNYWAKESVHEAVWLSVFMVFVIALFLLPNKYFAYYVYFASLLKIIGLTIVIIVSIVIIAGGGPTGRVHNGEYWRTLPVFANGFQGFSNCALLALWAVGDQVFVGILAGEADAPRVSMGRATKLIPYRNAVLYMSSVVLCTLMIPMNDDRLFGGSGSAASPFVIAMNDAGISGVPDFFNVVIIIGIAGVAVESIYISSRVLRSMAEQELIPRFVARVDSRGRPRWSLAITLATGTMLTYINLSNTGAEVFTWLNSITSSSLFIVWLVVCLTSWRFRAALKVQGDPLFNELHAWSCWAWPFPTAWLFVCSVLLLVCCIYIGLVPIGSTSVSAYSFFQYMIGAVIVVVFTAVHKAIYRTKLQDPATADLKSGRHILTAEEVRLLDVYYRMPAWRRSLSYFRS
ncbi:amino acid permease [Diplodia corticola]|uniref:Amino acid permease n=1 Tax=Diplodia corticola TaxID=236234 RepID=A0A1J9QUT1_9PEZI|nr:amino acid permease [Diplodia corticola]OJD31730.1 amino acid permease [Diplodia corticola]